MSDFTYSGGMSEDCVLARSKDIVPTVTAGTYTAITIPKRAFLTSAYLIVQEVCTNIAVSIGWKGNGETAVTGGLIPSDVVDVTTVGVISSIHATVVSFEGKWFRDASGAVTITFGGSLAAGRLIVMANYFVIH